MQASYEVSLYGSFPPADLEPILQRCTLRSTASKRLNVREITFEPVTSSNRPNAALSSANIISSSVSASSSGPQINADTMRRDQIRIACQRDLDGPRGPDGLWTFYAYSKKPEPSRNETTVRQAHFMQIIAGNALGLAAALGYKKIDEVLKRGYEFERGKLTIQIFQVDVVDTSTSEIRRAASDAPWQMEIKTLPVRNVAQGARVSSDGTPSNQTTITSAPLMEQTEAVLEFRGVMTGLLDLTPLVLPPKEMLR